MLIGAGDSLVLTSTCVRVRACVCWLDVAPILTHLYSM